MEERLLSKIAAVKILPRLTRLAVFASTSAFLLHAATAQVPEASGQIFRPSIKGLPALPPTALEAALAPIQAVATISLGASQPVSATCRKGIFERVGLQPDQVVSISVQYPVAAAGRTIIAEPLDGGRIVAKEIKPLVVGIDGTLNFQFQAAREPGVCQISLHDGPRELGLQFWVIDPQRPENNAPVVNPGI